MMIKNRIAHLEDQHYALDRQVDQMEQTGNFSDKQIAELKKKRLHFKDEIAKLKQQLRDESND
jgi:hypothetical protein